MKKKLLTVPGVVVAVLVLGVTVAFAVCLLNLPTDTVLATHGPWNQGANSTLDITLSDVDPGFDVTNGTYTGWCLEDNHQPNAPQNTEVTLLDSTCPPFPPVDYNSIPWDEVNYLLNHKLGTFEDIQSALWIVAGTNDPQNPTFPTTPAVDAMVHDAQTNGVGFEPDAGQAAAVILYGDGIGLEGVQDSIIEVEVPTSPGCDIAVEKFCSVPEPPEPFVCKDAKPIDSLSMIWNGSKTISRIDVYRDKFDANDPEKNFMSTILGPISNGDEVTADGYAAADARNDVDWYIVFADKSDGISRFHRSCSDEDMNGPEDCGKNEGNAKSTDPSFVNDWLFAGMAGNGLTLDCTPDQVTRQKECEVFAVKPGSCADGKPTALVFEYTGADCAATTNLQEGKFKCEENDALGALVDVVMTKDANKFSVEIDDNMVTIFRSDELGKEFPSEIKYAIIGADGTQKQVLHTSCSKPLNVDDQFGSLILKEFTPKGATLPSDNVIYTYLVTNTGTVGLVVDVEDDKLGEIADDLEVPAGATVELTEPALLTEPGTVENTVTVTDIEDPNCTATDKVTVEVLVPPASCEDGKPTALVFEYTGAGCAATTNSQAGKFQCEENDALGVLADVVMTKDANKFSVDIDGNMVTIFRSDELGKEFPSEIKYDIIGADGTQKQVLHTSCSKPLNVGDQFGSLILRQFVPKF